MIEKALPKGLVRKGNSPTFSEATIPPALLQEHALGPHSWGVLQLISGGVWFVDLHSGEERLVTAPEHQTIQPEAPHKLRLDGPASFRIDFYRADEEDART